MSDGSPQAATEPQLTDVADRHRVSMGRVTFEGRRRRPSGEKPPLPRPLQLAGWMWVLAAALVVLAWLSLLAWPQTARWWYRLDHGVVHGLADVRAGALDALVTGVAFLTTTSAIRVLRLATLAVAVASRQWYRLATAAAVILVVEWGMALLALELARERPLGVEIIADWAGPSHPSVPVASLTVTLVAMLMVMVPAGRLRNRAAIVAGGVVAATALARVYLGVDHPSDGLFAGLLAGAIGVVGFRLIAPDGAFPVRLRPGQPAHLDIDPERQAAIEGVMLEQEGMPVEAIRPHGREGSAGSTPLLIEVAGPGGPAAVFGKLYSSNHLRSDRAYKAVRSILYGALEDEVGFRTVSQLVEYEDYMLRVMRDAGVPTAAPLGFVELAPEREYLLFTEFLEGAVPILEAPVDEGLVLDALGVVRRMWDSRLAHRDVKPSNVMVLEGRVVLVDVAFATARPTAWREAIDLANMMLILSLRMSPERVYALARMEFAADDIAEAFAATHGVTMPSELRALLREARKATGVDHVDEFCRLAPQRDIIHVQRWSLRRIRLAVAGGAVAAAFVFLLADRVARIGVL